MKIDNKIIERLISSNDPIRVLGDHLVEKWSDGVENFDENENYTKTLERFLEETYGEIYLELYEKSKKELPFDFSCPIVVMDGMSLREASYYSEKLDFDVNLSFDFSSLPTITSSFREKFDYREKRNRKIRHVKNFKPGKIDLDGDEEIVWSPYPDKFLESIQEGGVKISSIEETFESTYQILESILKNLDSDHVKVISDHGYVRLEAKEVFNVPPSIKKKLKSVMKGSRYIEKNNLDSKRKKNAKGLVRSGYLLETDDHYMVKARYCWPVGGQYKIYQHGGISLLESLIPVMEVKK